MKWSEFQDPIICLAPMDGITNSPYRQIVRKLNPHVILFSEFTNVDGLMRSEYVRKRLDYEPCEHPFFMQLFGNHPDTFAEVAKMVEARGIMGIDVNMGCPAKKVVHSQHGSALMKEVGLACQIIESIRAACSLEVSVKTRLGWDNSEQLIPFAKSLESAGVSLLTIHGRTYHQAFRGTANWDPIYELKKHLSIPLIGNGDVLNYTDGMSKLKNLDGFMIGRKAVGNPWVFQDRAQVDPPTLKERLSIAQEHYHLLRSTKPATVAVPEFRKYLGEYVQGFSNAKEWRSHLMQSNNESDFLFKMNELVENF